MTTDRPCPWCGTGTGVLLGLLGCRAHFRCRQCGGEFSTTYDETDYYRGGDDEMTDDLMEGPAPREILVHLNLQLREGDDRTPDEIGATVLRLLNGGQTPDGETAKPIGGPLVDSVIVAPLCDEV